MRIDVSKSTWHHYQDNPILFSINFYKLITLGLFFLSFSPW